MAAIAAPLNLTTGGTINITAIALFGQEATALGLQLVDVAVGSHARVILSMDRLGEAGQCQNHRRDVDESDVDCGGAGRSR